MYINALIYAMLSNFFGLILISTPFLLIFCFKNRVLGFLYILSGFSAFHILLGLVSQYFHFFRYPVILGIQAVIALLVIIFYIINRKKFSFKIKIDWIVIVSVAIIIFELWSVHYFYTGEINTIYGRKEVVGASYSYPFFSDDWAGVAFTNYSINNNALPITNPLLDGAGDKYFRNIFIAFFAGLAEIFLILNLNPLIGFPVLTIISGSLICFLIYLFLKSSQIENIFAVIGALCLPWVMCSVNLPGVWNLFPFIGATILFLVSIISLNLKNRPSALISGLISLLIYPPFVVIIAPTLAIEYLLTHKLSFKKISIVISSCVGLTLLVAGLIFIFQRNNWLSLIDFFIKSIIRMNDQGCIPKRAIWQIIPFGLLPFAFLGYISILRKKIYSLIIPLTIGLIYWAIYAYCPYFFIIDYARIALITSYLIMITIGYGFSEIFYFFEKKYSFLRKEHIRIDLKIIIMAVFIALSFFYTRRTNWTNLTLKYEFLGGTVMGPIFSPVNNYLNQDDLTLFAGIKQKRFLTIPWKGLVIGVATGNYPVVAKPSIISNLLTNYEYFMSINCEDKDFEAKRVKIEYLYSSRIDCPNFIELGHSQEGLYLYKFQP